MLVHRGLVTLGGGPYQRSLAVLVCGGGARTRGEQRAQHLRVAAARGSVQWRPLELVCSLDLSTLVTTTRRSGGTVFGSGLGRRVRVSGSCGGLSGGGWRLKNSE